MSFSVILYIHFLKIRTFHKTHSCDYHSFKQKKDIQRLFSTKLFISIQYQIITFQCMAKHPIHKGQPKQQRERTKGYAVW